MASPFDKLMASYFDAYARHDAEGCAAAFTEDAALYSPWGPPALGHPAIAEAHRDWFEEGEENKTWSVAYARSDGFNGVCLVRFAADVPGPDGKKDRLQGISLNAMESRPDGQWRIRICSLNTLPSDTGEPTT